MDAWESRLAIAATALVLSTFMNVAAIPTFYGGGLENTETWTRVPWLNATIFVSSGDFQHYPWEADHLMRLADMGVRINFRVDWWNRFWNGERAWNTSVIDFYYNATRLSLLEDELDLIFGHMDMEKIWAVTLSEEGPGASYRFFRTPQQRAKYNATYHAETGCWLSDPAHMNRAESQTYERWLNAKNTWLYNHLYDWVKGRWPHLQVYQFIFLYPGAPPVWVAGADLTGLKMDAYMGDLYFYEVYDNPLWLYEHIRQFKTSYPDEEYHIWLWGQEPWRKAGLQGGFEHARRNSWVAYLAGADAIGWFNWNYENGTAWDREDPMGKRLIAYTNRLNAELGKLPVFKPQPQVLVIRDNMNYQLGLSCELGLFNEWDTVNQRTLVSEDTDLSRYRLVVAAEDSYMDGAVQKLNEYVAGGGSLILLTGFGWEQTNFYYNGSRTEFLCERGIRQEHVWGDVHIDVAEPNLLNVTLSYDHYGSLLGIPASQLTENHRPIGEYTYIDSGNRIDACPMVLYHNRSNPAEGSILYFGFQNSRSHPNPKYRDVVEAFLQETNYTRYVYRTVTRAYAANYLGLTGSLAKPGQENMVITQGEAGEGAVLAGVSNFNDEPMNVTYSLDLRRFQLEPGSYNVYLLDEGTYMGVIDSEGHTLTVPLTVPLQGTKLIWVSTYEAQQIETVNIFPSIPTEDDVQGFWPEKPEEETEPEPEPEAEPEQAQEQKPETPEEDTFRIRGFPYASIIVALTALTALFRRERRKLIARHRFIWLK